MIKIDKIYYFLFASIIIILLDYFGLLNFIKRPIDQVFSPIKRDIFRFTSTVKNFGSSLYLYPQIAKIREENQQYRQKQEELEMKVRKLTDENEKMRMQLGAPFPPSFKFLPAEVIGISRFLEIAVGSDVGVKKDQLVVIGEILIGRVNTVTPSRSNVLLVTDPDFKIPAITSRGTRGSVVGGGSKSVTFSKVLQKDPLFLGDQVVTAGDEFVPPNLLLGKVIHITTDETAAYKQAKIESPVVWEQQKEVFVITSL